MGDLEATLNWLGLGQYHQRLKDAGFDTWESVLGITERDLEVCLHCFSGVRYTTIVDLCIEPFTWTYFLCRIWAWP